MGKLEIAALALVLLTVVGLPAAVLGYRDVVRSKSANEFTLVGRNGQWGPDSIRVKEGDVIRLRLTSADAMHGFASRRLGLRVDEVYPGKVTTIQFVAPEAGTYKFACLVICGTQHDEMEGQIIVEAEASAQVLSAGN